MVNPYEVHLDKAVDGEENIIALVQCDRNLYNETLGTNNPQSVLDPVQTMTCGTTGIFMVLSAVLVIIYPLKKACTGSFTLCWKIREPEEAITRTDSNIY